MVDTIYRQAAIDALCDEYCGGWQDCKHYPKCENLKAIQNLPSAQPEQNDKPFSEMIHGMFDHIWDCQIDHPVFQDTVGDLMMAVIQCHKTLTEEKPEQKIGEWIKEDRGGVEYTAVCSKCGYATFWSDIEDFRYCPYCGKKMEKQNE